MAVSKKTEAMITQSSWIRKMFEDGIRLKQQFGAENVFDFSLGNPNVPPPRELLKALIEVAKDERPGVHAYMPNAGFPETHSAPATNLNRDHDVKIDTEHEVINRRTTKQQRKKQNKKQSKKKKHKNNKAQNTTTNKTTKPMNNKKAK